MRVGERWRSIWRIEQTSAVENVWLVLFLDQRRLFHFFASLSLASRQSEVRTGMGIWNPWDCDVDRDFVFLGRSQKNGARAPAGLGYLRETFSKEGLITLARIAMVYVFILVFWALWGMSNGAEWTLQAEKMDLHVSWLPWINISFAPFHVSAGWGLDLLAAQVQTANPILILIFIPLVNYVLYPLINSVFPLTPLRKIGIGLFITALSFVVIVWIQGWIDAGLRPHINWQFLAYVVLTLGEAMVSITGLEFSYTQAPNTMKSSVMALWLLTVASGELFVGLVNKWILGAGAAHKLSDYQYLPSSPG